MDQKTLHDYVEELQEKAKALIRQRDAAQAAGKPIDVYKVQLREIAAEMSRCYDNMEDFSGGSGDE